MARTVQEEEHAARINEILDAAQRLIYTKGYEQMTIRDLLDALQCSKGAFYHYFSSKQALLEALIDRMVEQMLQVLHPVVQDEHLTAPQKLQTLSRTAAIWKNERIDLLAAIIEVWYDDDNALVREKLNHVSLAKLSHLYQAVIEQGIAEGNMATCYPDLMAGMVMDLLRSMSNEVVRCLLLWDRLPDGPERIERCISAIAYGIERLLGMDEGSLQLIDPAILHSWGEVFSRRPSARKDTWGIILDEKER